MLGVIVFLIAASAIARMEFWQERANLGLAIWIFIAPWVLGFTKLAAASWDHWIVGVLIFLASLSMLNAGSEPTPVATDNPPRQNL